MHTAWVLWLAAAAFAVLGMLLRTITVRFGDLPQATRDALTEASAGAGEGAPAPETVFTVATVLSTLLALTACALTVWLAFRLRAGTAWARTLLDIIGAFLVVNGFAVLLSVFTGAAPTGSGGEVLTFVMICLQILAALCAGAAVWRQHTGEAMTYTGGPRGLL